MRTAKHFMSRLFRWWPSAGISDLQLKFLQYSTGVATTRLILKQDGKLNRRLLGITDRIVPANNKAVKGVDAFDFTIDSSTKLWCRVFVPSSGPASNSSSNNNNNSNSSTKLPIIIFYHGGGFALFGPDSWAIDLLCRTFAKHCRAVVVSCFYRLSPEHKYPVQYEDALKGFDWLKSQSRSTEQEGEDLESAAGEDFPFHIADFSLVFIAGDSAGGNLAHHVAAREGSLDASSSRIAVAGLILIMPFFGGVERTPSEIRYAKGEMVELTQTDWMWRAFLPPGADRDHPFCNVCGPAAPPFHSINMPKILVIISGLDLLQDRQIQYAENMRAAGKDCRVLTLADSRHGFYYFGSLAKAAWSFLHNAIAEFVSQGETSSPTPAATSGSSG